jgi:hypothetical protein
MLSSVLKSERAVQINVDSTDSLAQVTHSPN